MGQRLMKSISETRTPVIGKHTYVHPGADVRGDVTIGSGCWIGNGVHIHGGNERIVIGDNTTIEDDCVIYAEAHSPTEIGNWVNIGRKVIVRSASIGDWTVVGKGCVVSNRAAVGAWVLVGEGAVVTEGQEVPEGAIVMGHAGRVLSKRVDARYKARLTVFKKTYIDLAGSIPRQTLIRRRSRAVRRKERTARSGRIRRHLRRILESRADQEGPAKSRHAIHLSASHVTGSGS
jgi:carbonic anhydrase/acetyltransferase-like protein (isoleucine patch superfamily)